MGDSSGDSISHIPSRIARNELDAPRHRREKLLQQKAEDVKFHLSASSRHLQDDYTFVPAINHREEFDDLYEYDFTFSKKGPTEAHERRHRQCFCGQHEDDINHVPHVNHDRPSSRPGGTELGELLHKEAHERLERQEDRRKKALEEEKIQCPFHPDISHPDVPAGDGFLERQSAWEKKRSKKSQAEKDRVEGAKRKQQAKDCSFSPHINRYSGAPPPEDDHKGQEDYLDRMRAARSGDVWSSPILRRERQLHAWAAKNKRHTGRETDTGGESSTFSSRHSPARASSPDRNGHNRSGGGGGAQKQASNKSSKSKKSNKKGGKKGGKKSNRSTKKKSAKTRGHGGGMLTAGLEDDDDEEKKKWARPPVSFRTNILHMPKLAAEPPESSGQGGDEDRRSESPKRLVSQKSHKCPTCGNESLVPSYLPASMVKSPESPKKKKRRPKDKSTMTDLCIDPKSHAAHKHDTTTSVEVQTELTGDVAPLQPARAKVAKPKKAPKLSKKVSVKESAESDINSSTMALPLPPSPSPAPSTPPPVTPLKEGGRTPPPMLARGATFSNFRAQPTLQRGGSFKLGSPKTASVSSSTQTTQTEQEQLCKCCGLRQPHTLPASPRDRMEAAPLNSRVPLALQPLAAGPGGSPPGTRSATPPRTPVPAPGTPAHHHRSPHHTPHHTPHPTPPTTPGAAAGGGDGLASKSPVHPHIGRLKNAVLHRETSRKKFQNVGKDVMLVLHKLGSSINDPIRMSATLGQAKSVLQGMTDFLSDLMTTSQDEKAKNHVEALGRNMEVVRRDMDDAVEILRTDAGNRQAAETLERSLQALEDLADLATSAGRVITVHADLRSMLHRCQIFHGVHSHGLMHLLIHKMVAEHYDPGKELFREREVGTCMYFITRGSVGIYVDGAHVSSKHEGEFIGEVAVMFDVPRTATGRCESYVEVYRLDRVHLENALQKHPECRQHFVDLAKKRITEKEEFLMRSGMSLLSSGLSLVSDKSD